MVLVQKPIKIGAVTFNETVDVNDQTIQNIKQLIINDTASQEADLHITSQYSGTDTEGSINLYDSSNVHRYRQRASGIAEWYVGTAGSIGYSTPGGKTGIVIDDGGTIIDPSSTGRFDFRSDGSFLQMGFIQNGWYDALNIFKSRNVSIGLSTIGSGQQRNLIIGNGVSGVTLPSGASQFFAKDVSASSEMYVEDEAGNETVLSPHGFEDGFIERSGAMDWLYRSKNHFVGKEIAVNLFQVIKDLEQSTGKSYIKIKDLPPDEVFDWDEHEERKRILRQNHITKETNRKNEYIQKVQETTLKEQAETNPKIKLRLKKSRQEFEKIRDEIAIPETYTKKIKPAWVDLPKPSSNVSVSPEFQQSASNPLASMSSESTDESPSILRRIANIFTRN